MSWRSFPISCWVLTPCWISLNTRSKLRSSRRTPRTSIGLCKVFLPRSRKAPCSASTSLQITHGSEEKITQVDQGVSLEGGVHRVPGSMFNVPGPTTLIFELGTLNSLVENDQ